MLTADGIRIAIFYTKVYNRLLVPITAVDQPQAPPELRAALSTIHRHIDHHATAHDYLVRLHRSLTQT
jgi:hypothetical protein